MQDSMVTFLRASYKDLPMSILRILVTRVPFEKLSCVLITFWIVIFEIDSLVFYNRSLLLDCSRGILQTQSSSKFR